MLLDFHIISHRNPVYVLVVDFALSIALYRRSTALLIPLSLELVDILCPGTAHDIRKHWITERHP